jgi:hypothetical protein
LLRDACLIGGELGGYSLAPPPLDFLVGRMTSCMSNA